MVFAPQGQTSAGRRVDRAPVGEFDERRVMASGRGARKLEKDDCSVDEVSAEDWCSAEFGGVLLPGEFPHPNDGARH
jgi:hypothetical protein